MKVCGIEISESAKCTLLGWPMGLDHSVVARLKIEDNGRTKTHHLTKLESGLDENALMGVVCSIKFIEKENEENEKETMAVIISGEYKEEFITLEIKKENGNEKIL